MRPLRLFVLSSLALLFAACEAPDAEPAPGAGGLGHLDDVGSRSDAVDVNWEAVLAFQGDFTVTEQRTPIKAGGRLTVLYDPRRLPNCRATYNGMPTWSMMAWYRFSPDGPIANAPLRANGAWMQGSIPIPVTATRVELWFQNNDRGGCSQFDSQFGANYRYAVSEPQASAEVRFGADWQESVEGALVAGGIARIVYAPGRLPACRATYAGGRAWNIVASYRFSPGGQTGDAALFTGDYYAGDAGVQQPEIAVPNDAQSVEFWFSNTDRASCSAWDSNFAENYRFPIAPRADAAVRIGWVGNWDFVTYHRDPGAHYGDADPAYYWKNWEGMPQTSWVEVQVWIPGLSDRDYADPAALQAAAARIRAEAVTDALAGPVDGRGTVPLHFAGKRGNDFVYQFRFWQLGYVIYQNPPVADGLYHYALRFSADNGATWLSAGKDDGSDRRFVIANQLQCGLFPDHAPAECPQARPIGWAGNWGQQTSHACTYREGLPDPVTAQKSGLGHDCMVVTAELYVAGLTDQNGDAGAVSAQVETDIAFGGGPLAQPTTHPLQFLGRVGNNYRYGWNLAEHVGRSDRGDYRFRFRFSGDGGANWYVIGTGDGPGGGGWRGLQVRLDSSDVDPGPQPGHDSVRWTGPTNSMGVRLDYVLAGNAPANNCEFYINALGRGSLSHNQVWADWLEGYLRIAPQQGELLEAGMWVRYRDHGVPSDYFAVGTPLEPNYWKVGFTSRRNATAPGEEPLDVAVESFAFFIDVRRPAGQVERLWQSNGGANYTLGQCYAVPGFVQGIGLGSIEYADESVGLFDPKRACR